MTTLPLLRVGDVIDDKYILERELGQGGMGAVFAARHKHLGDVCAVKVMLDVGEANDEMRQRFMNEARLTMQIDSPHVARARDSGFFQGLPYIVMELMEGEDLEQSLVRRGKIPVPEVIDILVEICDALAQAHQQSIIHRDIKPANIFLVRQPDGSTIAKLLDFGISKAPPGIGNPSLTKTSSVMGSPLYMSPEQLKSSKGVDPRTDIWALGVIAFETISGRPPFDGESFAQIFLSIVSGEIPGLRTREPSCPAQIDAAVASCLVRDRDARTASVAEFAVAIAPWGTTRSLPVSQRLRGLLPPSSDPTLAVASPLADDDSTMHAGNALADDPHADDRSDSTVMMPSSVRMPVAAQQVAPPLMPQVTPQAPPQVTPVAPPHYDPRASSPQFDPRASAPQFDPRASAPRIPVDPRMQQPPFAGNPHGAPYQSNPMMPVAQPLSNPHMQVAPPMMQISQPLITQSGPQLPAASASGGWAASQRASSKPNVALLVGLALIALILLAAGSAALILTRHPQPRHHPHERER